MTRGFTNEEIAQSYLITRHPYVKGKDIQRVETTAKRIEDFDGSLYDEFQRTKKLPRGITRNSRDRNIILKFLNTGISMDLADKINAYSPGRQDEILSGVHFSERDI